MCVVVAVVGGDGTFVVVVAVVSDNASDCGDLNVVVVVAADCYGDPFDSNLDSDSD